MGLKKFEKDPFCANLPSKLWTMEEIGAVTSWASPVYPSYLVLLVIVLDQSLEFPGYIRLNFY